MTLETIVDKTLQNVPLGQKTIYQSEYNPALLFAIARSEKRNEIHVPTPLPFYGYDIWNAYEISWLNAQGKPIVAVAEFIIPCTSTNIIESKSFKLYLNSLNNSRFDSVNQVKQLLENDLSEQLKASLTVNLITLQPDLTIQIKPLPGECLDSLDITCNTYEVNPDYLSCSHTKITSETLHSNLLKSNCLVTNQPDWGSLVIDYTGQPIDNEGLLKYIVSFRNHNEFHEHVTHWMTLHTAVCKFASLRPVESCASSQCLASNCSSSE